MPTQATTPFPQDKRNQVRGGCYDKVRRKRCNAICFNPPSVLRVFDPGPPMSGLCARALTFLLNAIERYCVVAIMQTQIVEIPPPVTAIV
jgi:hypothetical protein